MADQSVLVRELLHYFLGSYARPRLHERLNNAVPGITQKMEKKGIVYPALSLSLVSRDALFRLWRVLIPSGDVADIIRDTQEGAILKMIQAKPQALTNTTQAVVVATVEAMLNLTFGND